MSPSLSLVVVTFAAPAATLPAEVWQVAPDYPSRGRHEGQPGGGPEHWNITRRRPEERIPAVSGSVRAVAHDVGPVRGVPGVEEVAQPEAGHGVYRLQGEADRGRRAGPARQPV